ncbi:MAG: outer membrane beta-barrel protein [Burkholderiaceae bacterium]
MNRVWPIILGLSLASVSLVSSAQGRWHWEAGADVAEPTRHLGNADLKTGIGFEGLLSVDITPRFGLYGGVDWHRFEAGRALTGFRVDAQETGYVLGLQWQDRFSATSRLGYRLRGGATYSQIELEDRHGDSYADSGHGSGWEVGAALLISLPNQWTLTPGIRYRAVSRTLPIGNDRVPVNLEYVRIGVSVTRPF